MLVAVVLQRVRVKRKGEFLCVHGAFSGFNWVKGRQAAGLFGKGSSLVKTLFALFTAVQVILRRQQPMQMAKKKRAWVIQLRKRYRVWLLMGKRAWLMEKPLKRVKVTNQNEPTVLNF